MKENPKPSGPEQTSELLILDDGNILAHNLTPAMAALLAELNPNDDAMRQRAKRVPCISINNASFHQLPKSNPSSL